MGLALMALGGCHTPGNPGLLGISFGLALQRRLSLWRSQMTVDRLCSVEGENRWIATLWPWPALLESDL